MTRLHVSGPSLFQPGGLSYFKVPHKYRKVIKGAALEVLAALDAFCLKRTVLVISDAVIARFLDRSIRYVQRGLRRLESTHLIWRFTEWLDGMKCRTIFILEALVESDDQRRKRERAEKLASKNFCTGMDKKGANFGSTMSSTSSFEEEQCKDQQAPQVGESDGTDPPCGLGGEDPSAEAPDPARDAEAVAAFRARFALPVPVKAPARLPMASAPRRPLVPSLAERKRRAEPLARAGDRVAIAELAEIEAAERAAAARDPAPASTPPPAPAEPPKSDPPKTLWQKLTPWSRKKLE